MQSHITLIKAVGAEFLGRKLSGIKIISIIAMIIALALALFLVTLSKWWIILLILVVVACILAIGC